MSGPRRSILLAVTAGVLLAPAAAPASAPSDPLLDQQWALAADGPLGAPAAWSRTTGAGAVVAVLDTGADMTHPDLQGALWTNPGEVPGNGVDDDGDGWVDDVHGIDLVNHDSDPSDDEGHGTHVAGIIAARAGDDEGGAGLAPGAQVMLVKVLDDHRAGTASNLAKGIEYALARGARILNTSVNGDDTSVELRAALAAATAAGATVVASAGNDGRDIDAAPSYPASYPDLSLLTVAAEGEGGALAPFSNRGLAAVDVAAPGENILSTANGGGYELRSGTSMAAPFASATLALMASARPDLPGPALRAALLASARRTSLLGGLLGAGALDAAGAVAAILGPLPPALAPTARAAVRASSSTIAIRALKTGRRAKGATLRWFVSGNRAAVANVRVTLDGRTIAKRKPSARSRLVVKARPGRHRYGVVLLDAHGRKLAALSGAFRVARR